MKIQEHLKHDCCLWNFKWSSPFLSLDLYPPDSFTSPPRDEKDPQLPKRRKSGKKLKKNQYQFSLIQK